MKKYQNFIFEKWNLNHETKELVLSYSYDQEKFFHEKITFDFPWKENVPFNIIKNACNALWICAGISYYKAFIPENIIIKEEAFTKDQLQFFEKLYLRGLSEFIYKNKLDPLNSISFMSEVQDSSLHSNNKIENTSNYCPSGNIVALGGGKDSLTTCNILKKHNIDFSTWTVETPSFFEEQIQNIGKEHIHIQRKVDKSIIELNKQGAYNGHVPISTIWAFIGIITAILQEKRSIILSNEASAEEENTSYKGLSINHQYSKTLECEKDIQNYVQKYIHSEIQYFSFLRPFSELKIAEIFCKRSFEKFKNCFGSCNRNFKISNTKNTFIWCNDCPKCCAVWILFSAFLPKEKLVSLFGADLFESENNQKLLNELLGLSKIKPLECVGAIEENRIAVMLAKEKFTYPEYEKYNFPEIDINEYKKLHESSMPEMFLKIIEKISA